MALSLSLPFKTSGGSVVDHSSLDVVQKWHRCGWIFLLSFFHSFFLSLFFWVGSPAVSLMALFLWPLTFALASTRRGSVSILRVYFITSAGFIKVTSLNRIYWTLRVNWNSIHEIRAPLSRLKRVKKCINFSFLPLMKQRDRKNGIKEYNKKSEGIKFWLTWFTFFLFLLFLLLQSLLLVKCILFSNEISCHLASLKCGLLSFSSHWAETAAALSFSSLFSL